MHYSNLISTKIPKNVSNEILAYIDEINGMLPNLLTLSKEELDSLPKVSYDNIDFVHEVLAIAEEDPSLIPDNIDISEIRKDVELTDSILRLLIPLKQLVKKLENNALLAGSEAYVPSMAIYNALKTRKKRARIFVAVS